MNKALLGAAIALAGAIILLLATRGLRGEGDPLAAVTRQAAAPADAPERSDPRAPPLAAQQEARRIVQEVSAEGASPEDPEGFLLRGTVVVVDEHGSEHSAESGSVGLFSWSDAGRSRLSAEVHEGAFEVRLPATGRVAFTAWTLGGRRALTEDRLGGAFEIPPDGFLAVRARWQEAILLHVRDAASRASLFDVTVVERGVWEENGPHPGVVRPGEVLVASAVSPIVLPDSAGSDRMFYVSTPEHAWTTVLLKAVEGGDREVLLEPAGDLEVEIVGAETAAGTALRVRDDQGELVAELDPGRRRSLRVERLPAGELEVSAELGNWWKHPLVLASKAVELRPGVLARLTLELADPPTVATVPLGGIVVLPQAWELDDFRLVVELLDPPLDGREPRVSLPARRMERDPERPEVHRWKLDDVQPGRYRLQLSQLYYSVSLRVDEPGREDVVLEIPPPVEVAARVVDAATGAPTTVRSVIWNPTFPEGVTGGGVGNARWDAGTGAWTFRAPRAEVDVRLVDELYRGSIMAHRLVEGSNELTLRADRVYRVDVALSCEGSAVHWPPFTRLELRPAGGGEEKSAAAGHAGPVRVAVERPGTWIVTVPEIPGYDPVPPQEVFVGAEGVGEHVIELVPRR